jgi:hypothetical protein
MLIGLLALVAFGIVGCGSGAGGNSNPPDPPAVAPTATSLTNQTTEATITFSANVKFTFDNGANDAATYGFTATPSDLITNCFVTGGDVHIRKNNSQTAITKIVYMPPDTPFLVGSDGGVAVAAFEITP